MNAATSFLNPDQYPAALVLTYHERWEIELVIDEVDTRRRPRQPFRSQTPEGVVQALYGMLLAHYAIRAPMHTVAVWLEVPPDRLSFVHSLRTLRDWSIHLLFVARRQWRQVVQRVLRILGEVVLPLRADRAAPRQVKRKISRYLRKRPDDPPALQPTKPLAESFVIRPMDTRTLSRPNAYVNSIAFNPIFMCNQSSGALYAMGTDRSL